MVRALRTLATRPCVTLVAVATLAIGFGVNTAIFSLTRTVLLRPLPYRDADRLVQVNETNLSRGSGLTAVAPANYVAWRERTRFVRRGRPVPARLVQRQHRVLDVPRAEQVEGFIVSPNFFAMIGVQPEPSAVTLRTPTAPPGGTTWCSERRVLAPLLRRRPGSRRPDVTVDGVRCTVIGVLPARFKIFRVLNRELDLFRPLVVRVRPNACS